MLQNKILIATNNIDKVYEYQSILKNYDVDSLIGKNLEIEETGVTFEENALIKAKAASEKFHCIVLADDSGICCNGLNGDPGIYSARYANSSNHDDNLYKLIKNLEGIDDKSAYFITVLCLYFPNGEHYFFDGTLEGTIIDHFIGDNGFGYDKIFYLEKYHKTLAEITSKEKSLISHRAKATIKLKESNLL